MKISKKQGFKAFAGMTMLATAISMTACNDDDNKSSGGPSQEESGYVS